MKEFLVRTAIVGGALIIGTLGLLYTF